MKSILKSKRAAEMTIGTIIIIILALVVLIFLVFAFSKGSGGLFDNIKNFFGGGPNVDTIKNACQVACTTQSKYAFCDETRILKTQDKPKGFSGSCEGFATTSVQGASSLIPDCAEIKCDTFIEVRDLSGKCSGTSTLKCEQVNNPSKKNCETLGCNFVEQGDSNPAACSGNIDCTKYDLDSCIKSGCTWS